MEEERRVLDHLWRYMRLDGMHHSLLGGVRHGLHLAFEGLARFFNVVDEIGKRAADIDSDAGRQAALLSLFSRGPAAGGRRATSPRIVGLGLEAVNLLRPFRRDVTVE